MRREFLAGYRIHHEAVRRHLLASDQHPRESARDRAERLLNQLVVLRIAGERPIDATLELPAALREPFWEFLGQYRFTREELDPDDPDTALDPEVLGYVHENLLEDNRHHGAFYTPKAIVQAMCRDSLISYLQGLFADDPEAPTEIERLLDGTAAVHPQDGQGWLARHAARIERELADITICDPAIGAGAFAIGMLQVLLRTRLTLRPTLDRAQVCHDIVTRCLHGVDIDAGAVEITRQRLRLALLAAGGQARPDLDRTIVQGDSLLDPLEVLDGRRFDVVLGNPPYVDAERMAHERPDYRVRVARSYETARGNWDLYVPFWERSFGLLRERGVACLLTPNKWLSIGYGKALRRLLGPHLRRITDLSRSRAIASASVFPVAVVVGRTRTTTVDCDLFAEGGKRRARRRIAARTLVDLDNFGLALSEHADLLVRAIESGVALATIAEVEEAFTVAEAYALPAILREVEPSTRGVLRLVTTGAIEPFRTLWGSEPITYLKRKYLRPAVTVDEFARAFPRRAERARSPKIILAGLRHFEAFFDAEGQYLPAKSTVVVRVHALPPEFVTAVLNSAAVRFFMKEAYGSLAMDGGINFSPANVSTIPIPRATPGQIADLVALERRAAAASPDDLASLTAEIDRMVCGLYEWDPLELTRIM